jgi:hypothetical protein
MAEIKNGLLVVAFDRENFFKNGLKPLIFSLRIRDILLEKINV